MASLYRAMDALDAKGRSYLVDPVLDPINFGFMRSLERYAEVRRERPDAEILMGTGNLTELTDADTTGITAVLIGIASELNIRNVLVVQVEPPYAAHRRGARPRAAHDVCLPRRTRSAQGLCRRPARFAFAEAVSARAGGDRRGRCVRARQEFPHRDRRGRHPCRYNRDGHHVDKRARAVRKLGVEVDGAHAFYLGAELAKAEIAWRLGKRYAQDEPLDWGVAADAPVDDRTRLKEAGHTLIAKKKRETT